MIFNDKVIFLEQNTKKATNENEMDSLGNFSISFSFPALFSSQSLGYASSASSSDFDFVGEEVIDEEN